MLVERAETRFGGLFDERWQHEHVCGQCGGVLVERWNAPAGSLEIACGLDATHEGYTRLQGYMELYRQDPRLVPIEFRHHIERKLRERTHHD